MNNEAATREAKEIGNSFSNGDGSTNWAKLESGERGLVFSFTNASKAASGAIEVCAGKFEVLAWKVATPERIQRREVSREQVVELMKKLTADKANTITFSGSL